MRYVYNYDQMGVFIGVSEAYVDPLETLNTGTTVYLLPASATFVSPPEDSLQDGTVYVWGTDSWGVSLDYRGRVITKVDSPTEEFLVTSIGPIPEGYSLVPITLEEYP